MYVFKIYLAAKARTYEYSLDTQLTSNALVQHANYFLEGLAPLERVQVAYSLFGKPAYDKIHSVQLSFR